MAWEKRGSAQRYFYTGKSVNGRVRKTYYGNKQAALIASTAFEEVKRTRAADAEALQLDRARWEPVERVLSEFDGAVSMLVEATFTIAGYHRHDRGKWRRRRGTKEK
jgi:hypothetical protein